MRKNLKKLFTTVMVIVMTMIAIPVSAEEITITVDDTKTSTTDSGSHYVTNTGDIIVSGIAAGDELSAYKILDTYYNNNTNVVTYEFTDSFKAFINQSEEFGDLTVDEYAKKTGGSTTTGSTQSTGTLDQLASAYAAYIKKNSGTVTGKALTASGTTATITTDVGSYLILPTATSRVYAVMVGNLGIVSENGKWTLTNSTIVAKVSTAGVDKKVGTTSTTDATYNIGDEFTYYVTATVPQYPTNATNRKYKLTDTLSEGLTFLGINTMEMKDGEDTLTVAADGAVTNAEGEKVATVTAEGQTITIDFDVQKVKSLEVGITYKAKLNESAVLGLAGNKNSIVLNYSNDPYGEGTADSANPSESVVRTYGIKVLKHETGNKETVLSGAVFNVYTDLACTNLVDTITTGADGYGELNGVKAGTYYLKEVTAPSGYSLIKDPIDVIISDDTDIDDTGVVSIEVANTKVGALPITGGTGTIIFTVTGAILMIGAVWFIFIFKRKNKNQEV